MKLIHYEELIATPWKNGGGITRELASYPADAALDDFLWRISIAEVHQSGPFSVFPGIDRIIALLDGDGMQLESGDGSVHNLTAPFTPYRFRGEDDVHATLAGTACRDFNLMLRRDAVGGSMEIRRQAHDVTIHRASFMTLFCAQGLWEIIPAHGMRVELGRQQALIGGMAEGNLALAPLQPGSVLVAVSITPLSTGEHHAH